MSVSAPAPVDHHARLAEDTLSQAVAQTPAMPRRALVAVALAAALVPLNSTMVAVVVPDIARDVGAAPSTVTSLLVTSYLLAGIVFQSPAGKLGDLFGHRRALLVGEAIFAAGAVLGFFGRSLLPLSIARASMAAGGAMMAPSAMALLRNELPPHLRARGFGMLGSLMGLAAAIGPMVGGLVAGRAGWPWIFLVNAPLLALSATLGGRPASAPASKRASFDVLGSILLGAGLALVVIGLRAHGASSLAEIASGVVSLAVFVWWERRVASPVLDLATFRVKAFSAGALVIAFQNLSMYSLLFEVPIVLARRFEAPASTSGRALLAMTGAMVIASPLGARLAERVGARTTAILGSSLALLGTSILALHELASPLSLIPSLVLAGAGLGLSTAPSQAASLGAVAQERSGMAAAALSTSRYLGGVIGVALLGFTFRPDVPVAASHSRAAILFSLSFLAAAIAALGLPGRAHKVD